jgi:hypothetical protein
MLFSTNPNALSIFFLLNLQFFNHLWQTSSFKVLADTYPKKPLKPFCILSIYYNTLFSKASSRLTLWPLPSEGSFLSLRVQINLKFLVDFDRTPLLPSFKAHEKQHLQHGRSDDANLLPHPSELHPPPILRLDRHSQ